MKRAILILFAGLYLVVTLGISINTHFCGGSISSINISFNHINEDCVCDSKNMSKDCCKNTSHSLKVKANRQASKTTINTKVYAIDSFTVSFVAAKDQDSHKPSVYGNINFSEFLSSLVKQPIYILIRHFTI